MSAVLLVYLAAGSPLAFGDDSGAPAITALDVMKSGRPANLFKVAYGGADDRCQAIAAELNKPFNSNEGYWETLTHTSFDVSWQVLTKQMLDYRGLMTESTRVDLYNDGSPVFVFRLYGMIHSRENTFLIAGGPGETNTDPIAAAKRLMLDGAFDAGRAVPPGPVNQRHPAIFQSLGLTSDDLYGYPLFDAFVLAGRTYLIEGNAYEFVDPDFLWVYSGRPDGSFSLDCVFDPQLLIPENPPDLYYQ